MGDLFLRACRREPVERRPVWLMRQAGRYLPEYRSIRQEVDFLTLCKTPELAARVTLQPVDILDVDAAILFADILLPLEAMGVPLLFEEGRGPILPEPVRSQQDFARLREPDIGKSLGPIFEAIRTVRRELAGRVPLIGFAGTPWTVAAYLVEGGTSKSFSHLLGWSYGDPAGLSRLLGQLSRVTADYLLGQVEAGAQAIQVFDTWGGLLSLRRWRQIALPSLLPILEGLHGRVPLVYYVQGGSHLLSALRELPVDVLSVDWRLPLDEVRAAVGRAKVLQGNLDPAALLASADVIEAAVVEMLKLGARGGHIVNLGHGILPTTPVDNAKAFVAAAKRHSSDPALLSH